MVRASALQDFSLIGRQVARMKQVTFASPEYLQRHGVPTTLADLESHFGVDYVSSATGRPASLDFCVGEEVFEYHLKARISVTGADLYTGAAVSGLVLVQVPKYRIAQELAEGRLIIVLPQTPPPMPVSVLYPQNRQLSARARVVTQWLALRFKA
jgi:DNA-binding transcriptional LysR family regulator